MYGNRNLDIARSRYRIHLHSNAAESVVNNDTMGGRTYKFNMPAVFNIDPKFQTSVVSLRTFTVLETPVKTHSAYTEPEPLVLSIRDTIADGAPARYLASSAITLGDQLGDGEFKWSASNSPFQINDFAFFIQFVGLLRIILYHLLILSGYPGHFFFRPVST